MLSRAQNLPIVLGQNASSINRSSQSCVTKGSVFALTFLDKDKWENEVPEYMPETKYFYYYEWMKDRVKSIAELPQCVLDKLLSLDGAELDLLLQHPQAIRGQTEEFIQVLDEKGEKFLETYKAPTLLGRSPSV